MKTNETGTKRKRRISRQTVNKINFFGYLFIFMAVGLSVLLKLTGGSLNPVLEHVTEIFMVILYCATAVIVVLDFYMDFFNPDVEKKDELYDYNKRVADSLTYRIVMIGLLVAWTWLNENILINKQVLLLACIVPGLISSSIMLILEHSSNGTESDEDET